MTPCRLWRILSVESTENNEVENDDTARFFTK